MGIDPDVIPELQRIEGKADDAAAKATTEKAIIKNMSIYDFYASMTDWYRMDWLKFLFHTVLSILIAIMTPIGLLTWDVKSASRIMRKSSLTEKEVKIFVDMCWKNVLLGVTNKITSERAFNDWCTRDGVVVSPGVYQDCARKAFALGIITRDGTVNVTDTELIKQKIYGGK